MHLLAGDNSEAVDGAQDQVQRKRFAPRNAVSEAAIGAVILRQPSLWAPLLSTNCEWPWLSKGGRYDASTVHKEEQVVIVAILPGLRSGDLQTSEGMQLGRVAPHGTSGGSCWIFMQFQRNLEFLAHAVSGSTHLPACTGSSAHWQLPATHLLGHLRR
eukprot:1149995-Pelagomonas_calceolata.AAC.1